MGLFQSMTARGLLAEFLSESVGTFFLTLLAGFTFGAVGGVQLPAMAIGLGAIFLYQSEKAHLNPIISIATALCDIDFGWINMFLRILAQILGAVLGGLFSIDHIRNQALNFNVAGSTTSVRMLCFEILFAAMLVNVFLRTRGVTVLAPVVYGLVYFTAVIASQGLYAAGNSLLNPAVALGLAIGSESQSSSGTDFGRVWLWLVGPFIGGLIGVVFYQMINALDGEDDGSDSEDETTQPVMMRTTVMESHVVQRKPVQQGYGQQNVELAPRPGSYNA